MSLFLSEDELHALVSKLPVGAAFVLPGHDVALTCISRAETFFGGGVVFTASEMVEEIIKHGRINARVWVADVSYNLRDAFTSFVRYPEKTVPETRVTHNELASVAAALESYGCSTSLVEKVVALLR